MSVVNHAWQMGSCICLFSVICGLFFHDVSNDIAGFQNWLGEQSYNSFYSLANRFQAFSSSHWHSLASHAYLAWIVRGRANPLHV